MLCLAPRAGHGVHVGTVHLQRAPGRSQGLPGPVLVSHLQSCASPSRAEVLPVGQESLEDLRVPSAPLSVGLQVAA